MAKVKRTERGWPAHYACARDCMFRRNTLLECDNVHVVVSTVGNHRYRKEMMKALARVGFPAKDEAQEVGPGRYYETMAFLAEHNGPYLDANTTRPVPVDGRWAIFTKDMKCKDVDNLANDIHEEAVAEITAKLERGEKLKVYGEEEDDE